MSCVLWKLNLCLRVKEGRGTWHQMLRSMSCVWLMHPDLWTRCPFWRLKKLNCCHSNELCLVHGCEGGHLLLSSATGWFSPSYRNVPIRGEFCIALGLHTALFVSSDQYPGSGGKFGCAQSSSCFQSGLPQRIFIDRLAQMFHLLNCFKSSLKDLMHVFMLVLFCLSSKQ